MKIKSLLLGSAAASMLAVSGAQAADPIIYAEPESMEYVRICDVYGAGFFYIPGTETCMRISGFARYQMGGATDAAFDRTPNYHGFGSGGWNKYARGRLNFDVRSETEYGTLRGFIRLETTGGQAINTNGVTGMNWGFVSLSTAQGELLAGYLESTWALSGPIGNYGLHSDEGGRYGFQRRSQVRYTFTAPEGFFGLLALEDNNGRAIDFVPQGRQWMPDVVGKAGISQAWGGAYGAFGYDAVDESWAARVGAQINVPNAPGSSLIATFYWADSVNNIYSPTMYYAGPDASGAAEWSAAVSYQHQFNPQFAAGLGYQYLSGFGAGDPRQHIAEVVGVWTPVRDLEIRTEIAYTKAEQAGANLDGAFSGFLRFQRNF